jgi:PAS domain S-box-containing protein
MRRRKRIAWKLSIPVVVIICVVILAAGLASISFSRKVALDAARQIIQFNSVAITSGIDEMMIRDHSAGVPHFIDEMYHASEDYRDLALIAHPSGRVAVSRRQAAGARLTMDDPSCVLCHHTDEPIVKPPRCDEVMTDADGRRYLQVVTPVLNKASCRAGACHSHAEAGAVLGVLRTQYSLAGFDDLMTGLNLFLTLGAIVAILLVTGAVALIFRSLLARPLRHLVAGVNTLAAGDLDFRFPAQRDDEIGLAEDSFNNMAARIQTQQRELRKTLENLEGILENTTDLIIAVDREGFVRTFNRGAELALGYERGEVLGRKVQMLFADPQDRESAIARLNVEEPVTNWETKFRTKDGQIRNVFMTLSRLRDRKGNLTGTYGISKDITNEKILLRKLFRSEQEAAIGRAVTAIQHAVKNMLNTLRGGLYVVRLGQKKKHPERIIEGCEMIEEGLNRISDLSLNMLKYAREWKIEPEPVDIGDMVQKIIVAIGQTARDRGVAVQSEIEDSLPLVPCDPRLMHMVLMDIASNALDACDLKEFADGEGPEIVFRVYQTDDRGGAVIELADNGVGMSPEVRRNVFTPFFSTKKKWGTGLGLALTSRIVGLHNGKIVVESEPQKGSVFRITLPLESQVGRTGGST